MERSRSELFRAVRHCARFVCGRVKTKTLRQLATFRTQGFYNTVYLLTGRLFCIFRVQFTDFVLRVRGTSGDVEREGNRRECYAPTFKNEKEKDEQHYNTVRLLYINILLLLSVEIISSTTLIPCLPNPSSSLIVKLGYPPPPSHFV